MYFVAPTTAEEFDTLTDTGDDYTTAKAKLTEYVKPKVNTDYEESIYQAMVQKKGEPINRYYVGLKTQGGIYAISMTLIEKSNPTSSELPMTSNCVTRP